MGARRTRHPVSAPRGTIALLGLLVVAGCATARARVSRAIYDEGPHFVKLVELRAGDGEPALTCDHPVDFVADDFQYILGSITASRRNRGGWTVPEPVLSPAARTHLGPHLARAFAEATHTEYIAFKVTQKVPGLLFPKFEVTAGTMFVRDGAFHLQIEHFNTRSDEVDRITYLPTRIAARGRLRLVPGEDMRHQTAEGSGLVYDHWIAADWPALQAKLTVRRAARARRDVRREERRREAGPGHGTRQPEWEPFQAEGRVVDEGRVVPDAATPPRAPDDGTAARLQRLDDLRRLGLITDGEYERKRREILDTL